MPMTLEEISEDAKLFSLPEIYIRLQAVLDHPDFSMADIVEVVSQDPAITARLLAMVNSSFFGFASKIDTISQAVSMLGSQQVHDLVLATSVTQRFSGMSSEVMNMVLFWQQSMYCGIASRLLASACNVLDRERLFVAGLLRDVGHLIMYQRIPELAQQAMQAAKERQIPVYQAEGELIGFDYAQVGGVLMRAWRLPNSLWESVEYQNAPEKAAAFTLITSIVHIASRLLEARGMEGEFDLRYLDIDSVAWQTTRLSLAECEPIHEEVEQQVGVLMKLMIRP